jgi:hypothetical protein
MLQLPLQSDMMGSVGAINNKIFTNADAKACIMPSELGCK